ncbi:hypothetical protein HL658_19340 [Azospirillum sp. RWY-5-1]|uniref:hypothetical protein n=1 Tax=Azospirillum oleiclasticum TaxID=2735135 RepID=UPI0015D4CE6D|nr:hypothetical protein [Azospirillum oleiclasticum]NYZ14708.1 hypothetical protein [Azospirillum oleiclasticum]
MITRLSIVHKAWAAKHGASARGGINALRGFRYQTLLAIETAVGIFRDGMTSVRGGVFQERLSDILEVAASPRIVQVKRTLDASSLKDALRELWSIHSTVTQVAPDLLVLECGLSYGIVARFNKVADAQAIITAWIPATDLPAETLDGFRQRISVEIRPDPETGIFETLVNDFHDPRPRRTLNAWAGGEFVASEEGFRDLLRKIEDDLIALRNARTEDRRPLQLAVLTGRDAPPDRTIRHEGTGSGVLTGEAPNLEHLRRGYFAPRPVYTTLADEARDWIEDCAGRSDPTDFTLKVLWLHGRSGSGKSVALLHMLAALRSQGYGPILWIGNAVPQLPAAMRTALDMAADGEGVPIIAIDDPYAPNANDNPFGPWDEAHALLAERTEDGRRPLILACGPAEQIDVFERDLTADRVDVHRLELPRETADGRRHLHDWYRERTGKPPPPYMAEEDVLLVQLFHDWVQGLPLKAFADRFRNRIAAMSPDGALPDLFAQILSLNRLYVGFPTAALDDRSDQIKGCLAQLADEFHLALDGGSDDAGLERPGVWLKHPHLSNVIYDRWFDAGTARYKPVRLGHLRDAALAALEHGRTPQERTAPLWTISRGASLDGLDLTGRLPNADARDVLRQVHQRMGGMPSGLAGLPVWIDAERRFPDLNLPASPRSIALERLPAASAGDTGLRLTCRHLLMAAQDTTPEERDRIRSAVYDLLHRTSAEPWHDWLPLVIDAANRTDDPRFAGLLATWIGGNGGAGMADRISGLLSRWPNNQTIVQGAIRWLHRHPPSCRGWSWVWEKACKQAPDDNDLRSLTRDIAAGKHIDVPTWSFVWERAWEDDRAHSSLSASASAWLAEVEPNHGSWKYVWEKLWGRRADDDLDALARKWLADVEPNHGSWKYVWEKLWERRADDELDTLARKWLADVEPNHGSWYYVWVKLWERRADDELDTLARKWLADVELNHGSWKYVWEKLWERGADDGLDALARKWLTDVEPNRGSWAFVWVKLWERRADDALDTRARGWLAEVKPGHGSWPYVWEKLWAAHIGDDALIAAGRRFLTAQAGEVRAWPKVFVPLMRHRQSAGHGLDEDLADAANRWLDRFKENPGRSRVLQVLKRFER